MECTKACGHGHGVTDGVAVRLLATVANASSSCLLLLVCTGAASEPAAPLDARYDHPAQMRGGLLLVRRLHV